GRWRELEDTARFGLACQHHLAAGNEELDDRAVVEASTRFRYERNLLSGDELEAWLLRWAVQPAGWHDYLPRLLLRERGAAARGQKCDGHGGDGPMDFPSQSPVSEEQLASALWPEAVCSGHLEAAAARLAADTALAEGAADSPGGEHERPLA